MSALPPKRDDAAARLRELAQRLFRARDARAVRTDGWQRIDEVLARLLEELERLQQRREPGLP